MALPACQTVPKSVSAGLEMSSSSMRKTILISAATQASELLQTQGPQAALICIFEIIFVVEIPLEHKQLYEDGNDWD